MANYNLGQFLYKFQPDLFKIATFKEIASSKGWSTELAGPLFPQVERDILTFDSFSALAELGNTKLQFGGGTLLNWVYARSSPRFSFDIDAQILKPSLTKEEILGNLVRDVNDRLRKDGKVVTVPFANQSVDVGTLEYDRKKDHFSDVLSLKRRVFALTVGNEAHRYIRGELHLTGDVSLAGLRLKEYFGGFFPRIEEVLLEIGIPSSKEHIFPYLMTDVRPLVFPEAEVETVSANVTEKEYIMAIKIFKLGKVFNQDEERFALNDFVKAVCDLSACAGDYDQEKLDSFLSRVCRLNAYDVKAVLDTAKSRIRDLQKDGEARNWYETSGQTSFLARSKDFDGLAIVVDKILRKVSA